MNLKERNPTVIKEFRAGREIEGMHRDRLLLLTTVGGKTGRRHTTPMMFIRDKGRLLVVASNEGARNNPHWYRNLLANPRVTVEVLDQTYEATAAPLEGDDREGPWTRIKQAYPFFAEYEAKVSRAIPVVELTKVS